MFQKAEITNTRKSSVYTQQGTKMLSKKITQILSILKACCFNTTVALIVKVKTANGLIRLCIQVESTKNKQKKNSQPS